MEAMIVNGRALLCSLWGTPVDAGRGLAVAVTSALLVVAVSKLGTGTPRPRRTTLR